jgi:hypothetical protein
MRDLSRSASYLTASLISLSATAGLIGFKSHGINGAIEWLGGSGVLCMLLSLVVRVLDSSSDP